MRMPVVLDTNTPFPPVETALTEPAGLLAIGGDLSLARLRSAYRQGIFPWYAPGEPLLWWSPDPRMVLFTDRFAPSHSLRKTLRRLAREEAAGTSRVQVRVDTAFDAVMMACASPRDGQAGSWITREMRAAYGAWHGAGTAHSVETWIDGELAGGLYGIGIGHTFFGESMFIRATDASKIALAYLVGFLRQHGVPMIDCQQDTRHLGSLGGCTIPRSEFRRRLVEFQDMPDLPWQSGVLTAAGTLLPVSDTLQASPERPDGLNHSAA